MPKPSVAYKFEVKAEHNRIELSIANPPIDWDLRKQQRNLDSTFRQKYTKNIDRYMKELNLISKPSFESTYDHPGTIYITLECEYDNDDDKKDILNKLGSCFIGNYSSAYDWSNVKYEGTYFTSTTHSTQEIREKVKRQIYNYLVKDFPDMKGMVLYNSQGLVNNSIYNTDHIVKYLEATLTRNHQDVLTYKNLLSGNQVNNNAIVTTTTATQYSTLFRVAPHIPDSTESSAASKSLRKRKAVKPTFVDEESDSDEVIENSDKSSNKQKSTASVPFYKKPKGIAKTENCKKAKKKKYESDSESECDIVSDDPDYSKRSYAIRSSRQKSKATSTNPPSPTRATTEASITTPTISASTTIAPAASVSDTQNPASTTTQRIGKRLANYQGNTTTSVPAAAKKNKRAKRVSNDNKYVVKIDGLLYDYDPEQHDESQIIVKTKKAYETAMSRQNAPRYDTILFENKFVVYDPNNAQHIPLAETRKAYTLSEIKRKNSRRTADTFKIAYHIKNGERAEHWEVYDAKKHSGWLTKFVTAESFAAHKKQTEVVFYDKNTLQICDKNDPNAEVKKSTIHALETKIRRRMGKAHSLLSERSEELENIQNTSNHYLDNDSSDDDTSSIHYTDEPSSTVDLATSDSENPMDAARVVNTTSTSEPAPSVNQLLDPNQVEMGEIISYFPSTFESANVDEMVITDNEQNISSRPQDNSIYNIYNVESSQRTKTLALEMRHRLFGMTKEDMHETIENVDKAPTREINKPKKS